MTDEPETQDELTETQDESTVTLAQEIARRIVALPSNTTSSGVTEEEVISIVDEVLALTE